MEPTENKLHRGSDYHVCIDPQKDKVTAEPTANHIHFEASGGGLGYKYVVQMNEPLLKKLNVHQTCLPVSRMKKYIQEMTQYSSYFTTLET